MDVTKLGCLYKPCFPIKAVLFISSFLIYCSCVIFEFQGAYAIDDYNFGAAGDWGCNSNTDNTVSNMVVPIWTLSSSTPYGCMHIHFSDILFSKKAIKNSPIGTFSGPSMSQHAAQSCSTCVFNNRVGVHVMRA